MEHSIPDLQQKADELSSQFHVILDELTENLGVVSGHTLDHVLLYEAASEELQHTVAHGVQQAGQLLAATEKLASSLHRLPALAKQVKELRHLVHLCELHFNSSRAAAPRAPWLS